MPLAHEINSNSHNIKINQNYIKEMKSDIKSLSQGQATLREDIDKMNDKINFIYNYIVKKKEKEDARWF